MILQRQIRAGFSTRLAVAWLPCCMLLAGISAAQSPENSADSTAAITQTQASPDPSSATPVDPQAPAQAASSQGAQPQTSATLLAAGQPAEPAVGKRQARQAESAYLAGAKKLQHDDLLGAESDFERAHKLDPGNRNYALAIGVAREHRVSELVQQAVKARQSGDEDAAGKLLAEARTIDPDNPLVTEHSGAFVPMRAAGPQALGRALQAMDGKPLPALTDRSLMLAPPETPSWRIQAPVLAGPLLLRPEPGTRDLHLRGTSAEVIRNVAAAYGISAIVDETVQQKQLRFDIAGATYQQAMGAVMDMTQAFQVPVDETTVIVAKDDDTDRARLERQLEETVELPGMTPDQINELAQVVRSVFDIKKASVSTGLGVIVVRAPQDVFGPLNETLTDLIESPGEVMVEVRLYEIDKTHINNIGATIPSSFSVFNVDQAASQVVSSNQSLVQEAIAQGLVPAGTSNLQIALALIAAGLVQNSLASNLIGVVGGGVFQTGISGSSNATLNLSLNSTDTRTLDDVQLRVGNGQTATFREGEKYPITQSTYSTGLSTASSALSNATINGVSVSSLLSQYSGGSSLTIPQVTYEDLGITLKAIPTIEKSGRIKLSLDMKIESLSGTSLDGNPVLNSRQFSSGLTVGNGESAMLVSSVSKTETASVTGLPGLSEIPGFQIPLEDNVEHDQSQLVVVVTPRIVRRRPDMVEGPRIPTRHLTDD